MSRDASWGSTLQLEQTFDHKMPVSEGIWPAKNPAAMSAFCGPRMRRCVMIRR